MARNQPHQAVRTPAASTNDLLAQAWALYQHGQLQAAADLCRRVVNAQPAQVNALQLLGIIEFNSAALPRRRNCCSAR